jgi:hypothetical protein
MAFRFEEHPDSRSSTTKPPIITYVYKASGEPSVSTVHAFAIAATANVVSTVTGILYRQDVQIDPEGHALYRVTVPYAEKKKETGNYRLTFDRTGGTQDIDVSLQTVAKYKAAGAADPPDLGGAIGYNKGQIIGTQIVIPALKLTAHFRHPHGIISADQIKNIARATGKVNSDVFLGYNPGEILFLGTTGSEGTDSETEIAYHFAASENLQNETIGGITVEAKAGLRSH